MDSNFHILIEAEESKMSIAEMFKESSSLNDEQISEIDYRLAGEAGKGRVLPKLVTPSRSYAGWGALSDFIQAHCPRKSRTV